MQLNNLDDLLRMEEEYQGIINLLVDKIGRKPPSTEHAMVMEAINKWEVLCLAELWLQIVQQIRIASPELATAWMLQWPTFLSSSITNNMLVYKLVYNLGRLDAIPHLEITGKLQQDTIDWIKDIGNLTSKQIREWIPQEIVEGIDKIVEENPQLPTHIELKLRELLDKNEGNNEDD